MKVRLQLANAAFMGRLNYMLPKYKSNKPPIFEDSHSDDEDGKMDKRRVGSKGKEPIHPEDAQLATIKTNDSTVRDKSISEHYPVTRTSKPL